MPILTGADIKQDTTLECDVCIVGSGAGGAHVAERLASSGADVIVLEEGGFHRSEVFDMTELNMNSLLYQEGGARATADQSIIVVQGRAVGGTTVVNWTTCFRTPERVFDHWAEHCGVEGPSYQAFAPHWERIEKRLNIHQMTLEQVNANNMVLYRGAKQLGWKADLLHRNVKNCAHTGYCGMGCPIDAKQSMLVTMLPDAARAGARVYANAWVERIEQDGRKVRQVVARMRDPGTDRPNGLTLTVKARRTVLSGGGINTPAMLLRSGINPNGRTGMRTFLHPALAGVGIHKERIEPFRGSPQYVHSDEFVDRGTKMGMLVEGAPVFPVGFAGFLPSFGEEKQRVMDKLAHLSMVGVLLHDGFDISDPDEGATVSLFDDGRPKVDYKWTPRLEEGLKHANRIAMQVQLAGGAEEVFSSHPVYARSPDEIDRVLDTVKYGPNQVPVFSAHVMGGCAMGTDPAKSVIDSRSLRHHEFDDLFVIDGSAFPTSCTVNPQVSIYGLASWGAEHVRASL